MKNRFQTRQTKRLRRTNGYGNFEGLTLYHMTDTLTRMYSCALQRIYSVQ